VESWWSAQEGASKSRCQEFREIGCTRNEVVTKVQWCWWCMTQRWQCDEILVTAGFFQEATIGQTEFGITIMVLALVAGMIGGQSHVHQGCFGDLRGARWLVGVHVNAAGLNGEHRKCQQQTDESHPAHRRTVRVRQVHVKLCERRLEAAALPLSPVLVQGGQGESSLAEPAPFRYSDPGVSGVSGIAGLELQRIPVVHEPSDFIETTEVERVEPARTEREPMRIRTLKVLAVFLALAVATQPLSAYTCDVEQNQRQAGDHSMMQMDHGADTKADCCDPESSDPRADCVRTMSCGTCIAAASIISALSQPAPVREQATVLEAGSGKLPPSHTSPPYHPPNS
jgi:hypothetical protein